MRSDFHPCCEAFIDKAIYIRGMATMKSSTLHTMIQMTDRALCEDDSGKTTCEKMEVLSSDRCAGDTLHSFTATFRSPTLPGKEHSFSTALCSGSVQNVSLLTLQCEDHWKMCIKIKVSRAEEIPTLQKKKTRKKKKKKRKKKKQKH